MAQIGTVGNTALGNDLQSILMSDDIQPGALPSYQLCKTIYLTHPMGAKMVETPVRLAMSQQREISIPNSPSRSCRNPRRGSSIPVFRRRQPIQDSP